MNFIRSPVRQTRYLYLLLTIVIVVVFLIFASFYKGYVHGLALDKLQLKTSTVLRGQARALENELEKFSLLSLVLAEIPDLHTALIEPVPDHIQQLNRKLASLAHKTGAPYIYVISKSGRTIASSNYNQAESFIGRNYEFRPYFKLAMENGAAQYFAKGERTGKTGLFFTRRIDVNQDYLGVIVVKVEFADITDIWKEPNSTTFVTNKDKIILFSSDQTLNFSSLVELPDHLRKKIEETKQFDGEPINLAPLQIDNERISEDAYGNRVIAESIEIPDFGWQIYRTALVSPALKAADLRIQLRLLSAGIIILGIGLFIIWRVSLERQRAQTTHYLKSEITRQTQELSNTNRQLENEIQEREQINKRFRNAREELAQANRLGSIGAITTSVAHEINQPVAAIRAFSESATKLLHRKDFARASENLKSIVELTTKIGVITNELRCYASRGNPSIGRVSLDRISVNDVIDGVELLIGDHIRTNGIKFEVTMACAKPQHVKAGRVRLEQVIVNIIQNAAEAVELSSDRIIEMRITCTQKFVCIAIGDNGPGIKKEIQSEIFNPFFTRKKNGLGIGLGIAKDIMNEFGGSIAIAESPLGGAEFRLQLQKYD